ncbi:MAG: hypothetical protein OEM05_13780, partial [Myxococcales bacterium]|nr:hypothetical protein [Myxococcales bacterium]
AAGEPEAAAPSEPRRERLSAAPAAAAAANPLDHDAAESRLSGAAAVFLAPDAATLLTDVPAPDSAADAITEPGPAVDTGPTEPLDTRPSGSFHTLHASGGGLDFDFESPDDPIAGDDPLMRVDSADLAEATVLDPAGASGFDVSSSDLGNAVSLTFDEPLEPPSTAVKAEAPWPAELPALAEPPPAAPPPPPVEPKLEPQPAPRAEPAPAGAPATSAEAALSEISPRLRQQLHDTLENIAWESFSDVTEKIVRQAVEKVEAIAWEVIPHLAETLVREEIRRMKGEIEND